MKKKIIIIILLSLLSSQDIRYLDEVFDEVEKTEDVIYGNAPDLPFIFLFEWNTQDIDVDYPYIYHRAKKRSLFYEKHLPKEFKLPAPSGDDLESISGDVQSGDTLYIKFDRALNTSKLKISGFNRYWPNTNRNDKKHFAFIYTNTRSKNIKDVIPNITIDSDDYTYPSRVTYEIRSCNKKCSDPSGTNYTLENNIYYTPVSFKITTEDRFAGIKNAEYEIPPIEIHQRGPDFILKPDDIIHYTLKSDVSWLEPETEGLYDDQYLKYETLDDDDKTIVFKVKKSIDTTKHPMQKLGFKIDKEGSFGIKIDAKVNQSQGYWEKTYKDISIKS